MEQILTKSERRQLERAKEKHIKNLKKAGYGKFNDVTDHEHTRNVISKLNIKPFRVWMNGAIVVQAYKYPCAWGQCDRLMIRFGDGEPIHDWGLLQRIKNDLYGPNRVGLEVYPSETHKQDVANMYWMFILPEGFECPLEHKRSEEGR